MGYGPDPSGYDPAGRDDHHGDPAAEPGPAPTPSPVPGERPWLCVHTLSESDPCEATNPHRGCIWANAPSAAPSTPGEGPGLRGSTGYATTTPRVEEIEPRGEGTERPDTDLRSLVADWRTQAEGRQLGSLGAVAAQQMLDRCADELEQLIDVAPPSTPVEGPQPDALGLLRELVGHETDPCRLDHHGYCQEHPGGFNDAGCTTRRARELLASDPVDGAR